MANNVVLIKQAISLLNRIDRFFTTTILQALLILILKIIIYSEKSSLLITH
ncbi:hypothetical protein AN2V17_40890 [Vallitalea sp. AN17-2]|uniref:Uncharacterized protein n=1 Tax=Vallitalea maricola TaxID=3074433 RepID=A0ACB5UPE6_9FIRM|nr:hypothetical protein AN2V17_40890 [Vallitalea sp. AN17-2]